MSENGDASEKIKVVDRRRFTDDGDIRPDWAPEPAADRGPAEESPEPLVQEPQPPPPDPTPPQRESAPPPTPQSDLENSQASSPLFLELVNDLAQQAALFIEGAQGFPAQPEQAQRLIDYLGMLESKTRGNLSAEESQILSNVVFQLRSIYVQKQT